MKPFVVIAHAGGMEPWGPEDLNAKGLTGSEEVVVCLAEALAKLDFRVAVTCPSLRGPISRIVNGVRWDGPGYLPEHWRDDPLGDNTVLVSSFLPSVPRPPFRARQKIFWPHSIQFDDATVETWRSFDQVVCATDWQNEQMGYRHTGALVPCLTIPYGIVPPPPLPKVPGKCLYASSPDRGLARLLRWWPEIREKRPDLMLCVAYGRDRMRGRAPLDEKAAEELAEIDRLIVQPGVVDLGFVSKPEMDRLLGESELWLYPTDFEETGCLVGRKAVAAGCRAVYVGQGCLREVLAPWLPVGEGRPHDMESHREAFVAAATGVLNFGRILDPSPSWSEVAAQWDNLLDPKPTPV